MKSGEPTILLVDDCKEDRLLLTQALADAGLEFKIDEASDAEEAELYILRKLSQGAVPHLIILDMNLPKRSGLEVLESWHTQGFTQLTRVIVLSSVLPEGEISRLRALGASRVLEKPLDLQEFSTLGQRVKELAALS
jgi:CheY-like chemotaxis protein